MSHIGVHLRVWRKEAGLTQRAVADACGVDHTYISRIEAGRHNPSLDLLREFAGLFGVPFLDVCRAARRVPKDVSREELERLWWIEHEQAKVFSANCQRAWQYIADRGLNKDFADWEPSESVDVQERAA